MVERARDLLAGAGVALVVAPEFTKTRLSGAARWLSPHKAIIQLSFRHKTDDHFWFSLFHEAGHVLGRPRKTFIDEVGGGDPEDLEEQAANEFARNILIPVKEYEAFVGEGAFTREAVRAFAQRQQLAPGIVVARLQRDGLLARSHLNEMKKTIEWAPPV